MLLFCCCFPSFCCQIHLGIILDLCFTFHCSCSGVFLPFFKFLVLLSQLLTRSPRSEKKFHWRMHQCSKVMSGLSLVPYFSVHHWLPCYSHLTRVSIQYSVCIPQVSQGTSKRHKFSWMLYWHVWSVQELLHKCGVVPLLARCRFTVPSNHECQGSRGVTTVCLVYTPFPHAPFNLLWKGWQWCFDADKAPLFVWNTPEKTSFICGLVWQLLTEDKCPNHSLCNVQFPCWFWHYRQRLRSLSLCQLLSTALPANCVSFALCA